MPRIIASESICPYCGARLVTVPTRKRHCAACNQVMYVKTGVDNKDYAVTENEVRMIKCERRKHNEDIRNKYGRRGHYRLIPKPDAKYPFSTTMKLSISLVPKILWGKSLRNLLARNEWEAIRQLELDRADKRCEVCGHQGIGLICHEVWEYDDERHIATLKGFQIVCRTCDMVHHIGRAGAIGRGEEAIQHLIKVNSLSGTEVIKQLQAALGTWVERNKYDWTIDWGVYQQDVNRE
ncbi:hypothetical protein ACFLYR_04650 [Chloroflexota bacterium]